MKGKKLVTFLLLVVSFELLLFSTTEAWLREADAAGITPLLPGPSCDSSTPAGVTWANNWHRSFSAKCPSSHPSLKRWYSLHRDCKGDRIHNFMCGYGPVPNSEGSCAWTSYQHDYDQPLFFRCPHNGFISGVASFYDDSHKDRKFGFRCCHFAGYFQHSCQHTLYLNNWDQTVYYGVPSGYYLVGAHSYHDNNYADRRWKFEFCKIVKMCECGK